MKNKPRNSDYFTLDSKHFFTVN